MYVLQGEMVMLGVIKDLDIEKYHSGYGVSRSGLMHFRKSPLHYWNEYLNPLKPVEQSASEALIFGNAFHTYILEPDKFHERYIVNDLVIPTVDEKPKKGDLQAQYGKEVGHRLYEEAKDNEIRQKEERKRVIDEFTANSAGKVLLKQHQMETLRLMKDSVMKHQQAWDLIQGAMYEHSIFWRDPHTDVLCKTRPDIWHENMTVDLKTAANADERSFTNSLASYGYHLQSAMNFEGIFHATGATVKNHAFIVVEKTFPYSVAVYILDETALELARCIIKNTLIDFSECLKSNVWAGYPTKTIMLPKWAEQ